MAFLHAYCPSCAGVVPLSSVEDHQDVFHPGTYLELNFKPVPEFEEHPGPSVTDQLDQAEAAGQLGADQVHHEAGPSPL